ncbi:MAG: lysozyme [Bacillota bacterium]
MKDGENINPEPFLDAEKTEYKRGDYGSGSCGGSNNSNDKARDGSNVDDNNEVRGGCSGYVGGICSGSVPGKCGGTAIGGLEDNESISDSGIEFLKDYEKFMKTAYDDGYDYKTIGYGHVIQPDENFNSPITENKAEELLKEDLKEVENYIDENVKIDLTQNQRDALTSLVFNVGTGSVKNGGIDGSKTIEKLNEGDFEGMKKEWKEYKKSNGKVSEGLVRRRADELEMFFSSDYDRDNDGVIN